MVSDEDAWTGDIFVVNRDGTGLVQITHDPSLDDQPAWSPDGTRIAFRSYRTEREGDIWTMKDDGSDPQRVTNTIDLDTEPSWSPDGATIAFRRSSNDLGSDICVVPATGGDTVRLTLPGVQRAPTWAPDGTRLVFVNQPTTTDRPDLHSMRPDGTDLMPVVDEEVPGGCLNPEYLKRR